MTRNTITFTGLLSTFALAALTFGCAGDAAVDASRQAVETMNQQRPNVSLPEPAKEFRAAWVATVANIDWPSSRNLSTRQQQDEMIAILDKAADLNLNAIVLQVRPAADALYPSEIEPWSEFLTGVQGQPPQPFYDPLEMWIEEAHARGMELHAWFNPYRAHHPSSRSPICEDHIVRRRPDLAKEYGNFFWLDPAEPEVQEYSLSVIMDVVERYDIDGVHFDDYFYPYKSYADGADFPDGPSWQRYQAAGGTLDRADWRRESVNVFVERVYREIKKARPEVQFGISPFGIWQPGYPEGIQGLNQYQELYADARLWLNEGWVDYYTPQLYWPIDQAAQSFTTLLDWWIGENRHERHMWPGLYTSRVGDGSASEFPPEEIVNQIEETRAREKATGHVHFSMRAIMQNRRGLADMLREDVYTEPALVPASPWLLHGVPTRPTLHVDREGIRRMARWQPAGDGREIFRWVVQLRLPGGEWETHLLPGAERSLDLRGNPDIIAVRGVDRAGNLSAPTIHTAGGTGRPATN